MEFNEANSSRYFCTCCRKQINKGEKFFHDGKSSGMRFSHTVNLCPICITKFFLKIDMEQTKVDRIKNEIMLEAVEENE